MIYGKSRNVVVIRNIDSDSVEQAILILKKGTDEQEFYPSDNGIVREAQNIINQYYQTHRTPKTEQFWFRSSVRRAMIGVAAVVSCLLFVLAISFF